MIAAATFFILWMPVALGVSDLNLHKYQARAVAKQILLQRMVNDAELIGE